VAPHAWSPLNFHHSEEEAKSFPEVDDVVLTEGSAVVIQVKSVRLELDMDLRKLEGAEDMIVSDPEIMRGTPVYRGTRLDVPSSCMHIRTIHAVPHTGLFYQGTSLKPSSRHRNSRARQRRRYWGGV